jgi:hypothetical protein
MALTARLESQLSFKNGKTHVGEDSGTQVSREGQDVQDTSTGLDAIHSSGTLAGFKALANSVDKWLECLKTQQELGRRLKWEKVFGQKARSSQG